MKYIEHVTLKALEEAEVLRVFAAFCRKCSSKGDLNRVRTIYSHTDNPLKTTEVFASRDMNADLSSDEVERLFELVNAFLHKSAYRKQIPTDVRRHLLDEQNYKCAICGCPIDMHAHADHIVPFKYVGDELPSNLQMLCSTCNTKKNADLYYQIKCLLGLV